MTIIKFWLTLAVVIGAIYLYGFFVVAMLALTLAMIKQSHGGFTGNER